MLKLLMGANLRHFASKLLRAVFFPIVNITCKLSSKESWFDCGAIGDNLPIPLRRLVHGGCLVKAIMVTDVEIFTMYYKVSFRRLHLVTIMLVVLMWHYFSKQPFLLLNRITEVVKDIM